MPDTETRKVDRQIFSTARDFFTSTRGQYIVGQALHSAIEALRKHEEENISLTLVEAITLVLEPAELFVAEAKKDSIGNSPRLKKAISQLREFIEN